MRFRASEAGLAIKEPLALALLSLLVWSTGAFAQPAGPDASETVRMWSAQFRPSHCAVVEWHRVGTVRVQGTDQSRSYEAAEIGRYSWPSLYAQETRILTDTRQERQILGGVKDRSRGVTPDGIGYSTEPGNEVIRFRGPSTLAKEVWDQAIWAPWLLAFHYGDADARVGLELEQTTAERVVVVDSTARRRLSFERAGEHWRLVRLAILGDGGKELLWVVFSDFRHAEALGADVPYTSQMRGVNVLRGGKVVEHPPVQLTRLEFPSECPDSVFALDTGAFATVDPDTGEFIAPGGLHTGVKLDHRRLGQGWRYAALVGILVTGSAVGVGIWYKQRR